MKLRDMQIGDSGFDQDGNAWHKVNYAALWVDHDGIWSVDNNEFDDFETTFITLDPAAKAKFQEYFK